MEDIGSVVRLLRAGGTATTPPSPRLDDLPALVEGVRAAGADIALTTSGSLDDLPITTALTVYRVVQEGLTNAVRHGVGTIHLDVERDAAEVRIRLRNDCRRRPASTSSGSGVLVMRERVEAVGGSIIAGPTPGGDGWALQARIPA